MTSASLSPCAGHVAPEVSSHAAILAWTHSVLEEPTFTSVWQASFRALCLSFDLGTLQPRRHHDAECFTSRPALGSSRQVRFNPNVSIALGLDADWTLQSFDISEASLSAWTDKPWSGKRIRTPRSHRNADERIFPLRHLPNGGQATDAPQDQPVGPFLHEAPQSIQDLFQALMEEDFIEGEELNEPVLLRSWYVHHRRVPEWNVPRSQELQGHWRFWAADILDGWRDQLFPDEDVALAVVFPNPPRNNVMQPIVFDIIVIQGLDLPRRACLATVLRFQDLQQRAERSLAISLPHFTVHILFKIAFCKIALYDRDVSFWNGAMHLHMMPVMVKVSSSVGCLALQAPVLPHTRLACRAPLMLQQRMPLMYMKKSRTKLKRPKIWTMIPMFQWHQRFIASQSLCIV